jgi:hypothetical protein
MTEKVLDWLVDNGVTLFIIELLLVWNILLVYCVLDLFGVI